MKRLRLKVTGDVQGVFYRHYAKEEAGKLGLAGWVRNDPDGAVFMIVEGEDDSVTKFADWAKEGSPMATVDSIDVSEEEYTGDLEGFEIR